MEKTLLIIAVITMISSYGMSQNINWSIEKDHSKIYFDAKLNTGFQSLSKFNNAEGKVLVSYVDYSNSINKFSLDSKKLNEPNDENFLRSTNYFVLERKLKDKLRMIF